MVKQHYHCRECQIILKHTVCIQNELSFYCNDCLISKDKESKEISVFIKDGNKKRHLVIVGHNIYLDGERCNLTIDDTFSENQEKEVRDGN